MILRVCVVIPTYNNGRTISEVVKDVVKTTPHPVLVVDDGSDTPVIDGLYSWDVRQALESGRVRVIRLEKNCGKGAALKRAIEDCVSRGITHMVTMDADGQHHGYEVEKLTSLAKANPWDLIIGNRKMAVSEDVPKVSKFGRAFSNFWVQYQTGLQIKDSQSGFRLYPLLPIQTMRFFTSHYDFEIEVLIRLLWQGVHVREIDIDVFYPKSEERVSHFHKLWDNVRISLLNTALVSLSLFRTHRSPREFGLALGIGVAVGCTPFFGFHSLIVAGLALALRLNVVVMWLGSHVSNPLLAPLVILGEIWIARHGLGMGAGEVSSTVHSFEEWLAGSAVLGIGLGLVVGLVTFAFAWFHQHRKPRSNWTGATRGGRIGNGFLKLVLKYGGIEYGYMCLMFVVPYFYLFAPKGRRGVSEYLRLLDPSLNWFERQKRIVAHFYRFGQVLMDRVYQGFNSEKMFAMSHNGAENITGTMAQGKGLILLSAHMGAWDLASALLPENGFSDQIFVVEFRTGGYSFQKVKDKMDPAHMHSLDTSTNSGDVIFGIHSALKSGECLGLMGDRPMADRFELIPFMGRLAPFDMTPFRLAAALRVPLIVTFGFKAGKAAYDFYAKPARVYTFAPGRSRELQLIEWATDYAADIEKYIRKYPDQWFNFYPFWSALPSSPAGGLGALSGNQLIEELPQPVPPRELSPEL